MDSICAGMTVEQIRERMVLDPQWLKEAGEKWLYAPPIERARFYLAAEDLGYFLKAMILLPEGRDSEYHKAAHAYRNFSEVDVLAEADGTKVLDPFEERREQGEAEWGIRELAIDDPEIAREWFGTVGRALSLVRSGREDHTVRQTVIDLVYQMPEGALRLPEELVKRLISVGRDAENPDIWLYLLSHESVVLTDEDFKAMFLVEPDSFLFDEIAMAPGAPEWALMELAKSPRESVQHALGINPAISDELLKKMSQHSEYLAGLYIYRKTGPGQYLSREDLMTGLTSKYKSARERTIAAAARSGVKRGG